MSERSGYALSQFLPEHFDGLAQAMQEGLEGSPPLAWNLVGEYAGKTIRSVLDLDVFEIFAWSWSKARELAKYTDPASYPPGETWIVHLGEHQTPVWPLHPTLQVSYAKVPGPRLRFTLELSAHFRSVALSLCNGYITAVGAGDGTVHAQLRYRDVALHKALESKAVKVGRPIHFDKPGIRIARVEGISSV